MGKKSYYFSKNLLFSAFLFSTAILSCLFCSCKKQEQTVYNFCPERTKILTVFSAIDDNQAKILTEEFEKVTGIWVKLYSDKAPQILEQISNENTGDVLLSYASDALSQFSGQISNYVKNNSLVPRPFGKKNLSAFAITQTGFLYNTIYFEKVPNFDLISKIKSGRLIAILNPYISSENYTCLYYLLASEPNSSVTNFTNTFDIVNEACESVAEGYSSTVLVPENYALSFLTYHPSSRTKIIIPPNPCYIVETASILKTCTNKDNADRFIAFLQNLGTQTFLSQTLKYHPVRKDMNLSDSDRTIISKALENGLSDTEEQIKKQSELLQQWVKKTSGNEK